MPTRGVRTTGGEADEEDEDDEVEDADDGTL